MSEQALQKTLYLIGAMLLLIFCLLPFIYMLITSVSLDPTFLAKNADFSFTLSNYISILSIKSLHFIDYFKNSFIISAISAVFCIIIASFAAYSITRLKLAGKFTIMLLVLAFSLFPQISIINYLFKMMAHFNLINTYAAIIPPYIAWGIPITLWILVSYFSKIPVELDQAGLIDGCSRWQILRYIIFPVALPGIFSALLIVFIFNFNEFMFALILTTNHGAQTIPVGIALFQGLHGEIPWGTIMAASTITTIPIILLSLFFQKRIIQGLTQGAIKA